MLIWQSIKKIKKKNLLYKEIKIKKKNADMANHKWIRALALLVEYIRISNPSLLHVKLSAA